MEQQAISKLREIAWYSLDQGHVGSAIFAAERLFEMHNTRDHDDRHLLGLCFLRKGRIQAALEMTLAAKEHLGCAYVVGWATLQLGKCNLGISTLDAVSNQWKNANRMCEYSDNTRSHLPDAASIYLLLGHLARKQSLMKDAAIYYAECLKINPFLWEAFDSLTIMGADLDVSMIFEPQHVESVAEANIIGSDLLQYNAANSTSFNYLGSKIVDGSPIYTPTLANKSDNLKSNSFRESISRSSLYKEEKSETPINLEDYTKGDYILNKIRRSQDQAPSRRSNRLLTTNKTPFKPSSSRLVSDGRSPLGNTNQTLINDSIQRENNQDIVKRKSPVFSDPKFQKSEDGESFVLNKYYRIALACYQLSQYRCAKAIEMFLDMEPDKIQSPFIVSRLCRAYYENVDYAKAEEWFKFLRQIDRSRTEDMEIYSTTLWHLHKDVELSFLAHDIFEIDRLSPQAWCILANCFSLERDHGAALKCIKRTIQLDPLFAYAYTLQGHEQTANEEYEKAQASYRMAMRVDKRHYNAWYGLGMVYLKIGKNAEAGVAFRKAIEIHPNNAVLLCCVGMIMERAKRIPEALSLYQRACELAPNSALALFKKAKLMISVCHPEPALKLLLKLQDMAPEEANIHFLLGKLYQYFGDKAEAIRHLTIAMNLDAKANHLIKETIEMLDQPQQSFMKNNSELYKLASPST